MLNFDVSSPWEEQVSFEILAQMQLLAQTLTANVMAPPVQGPEPSETGTPGGK